jgi:hypothetical protein
MLGGELQDTDVWLLTVKCGSITKHLYIFAGTENTTPRKGNFKESYTL